MTLVKSPPIRSLSELERQDRVLAQLPTDFQFPLFNGRQAVESQRRSGYQNTARAAREIIDNAYEAGAGQVHVVFERPGRDRTSFERKNSVRSIAFIDDGPGMRPEMARLALSWGGGTRFEAPEGIGRFGFGLPNSSINQTRCVEVYVRTKDDTSWSMCVLNIDDVSQYGLVTVPPPQKADLPPFVQEYLDRNGVDLSHGVVVVWKNPDRLSFRMAEKLREHMVNDFGVVYRYLLDDFRLVVEGTPVEKTDPLFLMPDARLYVPEEKGGAKCTFDRTLPVKYRHDPRTGDHHLELVRDTAELTASDPKDGWRFSTIRIRIARFPYGFASRSREEHGEEALARLQIRLPRRGMSFVRAKREIDTLDVFPKEGNWPQLQAYAYHWGVEVGFGPELDDVFGVTSDKQGVRAIPEFWEVMVRDVELDQKLQEESRYQHKVREAEKLAREKRKLEEAAKAGAPSPAEAAATAASRATGRRRPLSEKESEEAKVREAKQAEEEAKRTGRNQEEVLHAIREEAQRKDFKIEYFSAKGLPFLVPEIGSGHQKVARINEAHRFFTEFYSPLVDLDDGGRARLAVDLLLLALVDAELKASDERADGLVPKTHLEDVRTNCWSRFLDIGLDILSKIGRDDGDEPEEQIDPAPPADDEPPAEGAVSGT